MDSDARRNAVCFGKSKQGKKTKVMPPRTPSGSGMSDMSSGVGDHVPGKSTTKYKQGNQLSNGQMKAFKEVFDVFDKNGGGTIDVDKLDRTLKSNGIRVPEQVLNEVVESTDKSNSQVKMRSTSRNFSN